MIVPVLGAWVISLLATFFIIICIFMVLVVLIQKPRGGGLSGAFGGGGGSAQAAFGAKTGDFLTWFTVGCFVCFLGLAMGLTWALAAHQKGIIEPPPMISPMTGDEPASSTVPSLTDVVNQAVERTATPPATPESPAAPVDGAPADAVPATPAPTEDTSAPDAEPMP